MTMDRKNPPAGLKRSYSDDHHHQQQQQQQQQPQDESKHASAAEEETVGAAARPQDTNLQLQRMLQSLSSNTYPYNIHNNNSQRAGVPGASRETAGPAPTADPRMDQRFLNSLPQGQQQQQQPHRPADLLISAAASASTNPLGAETAQLPLWQRGGEDLASALERRVRPRLDLPSPSEQQLLQWQALQQRSSWNPPPGSSNNHNSDLLTRLLLQNSSNRNDPVTALAAQQLLLRSNTTGGAATTVPLLADTMASLANAGRHNNPPLDVSSVLRRQRLAAAAALPSDTNTNPMLRLLRLQQQQQQAPPPPASNSDHLRQWLESGGAGMGIGGGAGASLAVGSAAADALDSANHHHHNSLMMQLAAFPQQQQQQGLSGGASGMASAPVSVATGNRPLLGESAFLAAASPSMLPLPLPPTLHNNPQQQPQPPQQQQAGYNTNRRRPPRMLYSPQDDTNVSAYQRLVRQQVELFEADEMDVQVNAAGRSRNILLRQVGIRCRWCAQAPRNQRLPGCALYPSSLLGLYQSAQNMANGHLCNAAQCPHMPQRIRDELLQLQASKGSPYGGGKKYWAERLRELGVVETNVGLRFVEAVQAAGAPGAAASPSSGAGNSYQNNR